MFVVFQVAPILAVLLITGAMSFAEAPEYSIGFFNSTPGRISEARVEWKVDGTARHEGGGVMNSGVEAVFHQEPRPIPDKATVSWRTADGIAHHREVDVSKLITDTGRFSGTVYFKIRADGGVKVIALSYEEMHRLAFAHKHFP